MKNLTDDDTTFPAAVEVPEDADAANGANFEVGYQALADRTAYLNRHRMAESPVVIPASAFAPAAGTFDTFGVAASGFYAYQMVENNGYVMCDLGKYLPHGCTLTDIQVRVLPGLAEATEAARMRMLLSISDFNDGVADSPTTYSEYDDGSASEQVITMSPSVVIDKATKSYALFIRSSADGSSNPDTFYNVRAYFS